MKVGDYVTIQAIKDQSECRWVVLSDMVYMDYGGYEGTEGGTIRFIADTRREAGQVSVDMELSGISTLLIRGAIEPLSVGGVFVE
jgi:hypothetical protein